MKMIHRIQSLNLLFNWVLRLNKLYIFSLTFHSFNLIESCLQMLRVLLLAINSKSVEFKLFIMKGNR